MDSERYSNDLDYARASLKRQQYIVLILAAITLLSLLHVLSLYGKDRTIITPPSIEKSFWVTSQTAAPEYVEQMALWVASLILDVSADNIDYKNKQLLKYAHPASHGALFERQTIEAKRLRRDNVATYFSLQTIKTVPERLTAVITGHIHTLINGHHTASEAKNYLIRFMLDGGKAQLVQFIEIDYGDVNDILLKKTSIEAD